MIRFMLAGLAALCILFATGCAASDAAQEEYQENPNKPPVKPMGQPIDNGSAIAAKMITPVTGY
jgi:PBP1b-binding outer membrane lipoprotein LpoB